MSGITAPRHLCQPHATKFTLITYACLTGTNFASQFWEPEDDTIINEATVRYIDRINEYTKSVGQFQRSVYMGYAYPTQPVIEGYGRENVEFLRKVSRKYDPQGLFQKNVPGGFKLGA